MIEFASQTQTNSAGLMSRDLLLLATLKVVGERGVFHDEAASIMMILQQNFPTDSSEVIVDRLEIETRVFHTIASLRWGNCLDERGIKLRLAEKGEERMREKLSKYVQNQYALGLFWANVIAAVKMILND